MVGTIDPVAFSWMLSIRLLPVVVVAPLTVKRRYALLTLSNEVMGFSVTAAKLLAMELTVWAIVQLIPSELVSHT
jgi:hypothetical protein